jgi:uncharacterized protein
MRIRRPGLLVAAAVTASLATAALAGTASAHVTIPDPAERGGFSIVTFSVPNERDDSATVSLAVQLPQDRPLPSVRPQPKPGWTVAVTMRTLDEPIELFGEEQTEVVDTVTWSGGTIEPGQFDTFALSVGPLPDDVDRLTFPAVQTYASGEEVAWIEVAPEGGEEPEHPAPVLTLVDPAAAADDGGASATTTTGTDTTAEAPATDEEVAAPTQDDEEDDGEDDGADGVAVAALVIAIAGAVAAAAALVRTRRPT